MHLLGCTSVLNVDLERSWFSSLPPSRPERRVEEKLLSQCMTLSNWLGIKLLTTKTFAALKPIFKLVRASLMSALKSTTNSPWRKSRAHRGRSGCLTVCERVCVPTHKCVGESEHACGQYVCARSHGLRWRTHFYVWFPLICRPSFVSVFIRYHTFDVFRDFSHTKKSCGLNW